MTTTTPTKFATIRTAPSGKSLYIISWDASGRRLGRNIQNRSVDKSAFDKFVAKHNLAVAQGN